MLHHLVSIEDNERIVRLTKIVSALVDFICSPDNPFQDDDPDDLKDRIGEICTDVPAANWIADVRRKRLKAEIIPLIKFLMTNPDQRDAIKTAFHQDVMYHAHLGDEKFAFEFTRLRPELRTLIHALMVYLYEHLGDDGYPKVVMGDGNSFDRGDYIRLWEQQNATLRVCPGCDGKQPDIRNGRRLSDLDHFLPKSIYPFLSLHPRNLVPLCIECNQRIKGDTDPLEYQGAVSLTNSFHPYALPPAVDAIDVTCHRDANGVVRVTIEDREHHGKSPRITSLDATFGLEERWTGRIPEVAASLVEKVSEWILSFVAKDADRKSKLESIHEAIEASWDHVKIGSQPNRILYKSYLSFVLSDNEELDQMLAEI